MKFRAGPNMAMKVPSHRYEATITFYREIIGLTQLRDKEPHMVFRFGDKNLWIDEAPHLSQAEIWLEIECDDLAEAADYLEGKKIIRRDDIERLPAGFQGFWITGPADIIHLVTEAGQD